MQLIHTLLFMFRNEQDMQLAKNCLKSLEQSAYKTVVLYNQGNLSNADVEKFTGDFDLNFHIIGEGQNIGTAEGRQKCFEYIWENFPDSKYISELHLDMIFPKNWEYPLVEYLENNDEPLIGCGIIDKTGLMPFLNKTSVLQAPPQENPELLLELRTDVIVHGFTNPCIHVSDILKHAGGYNTSFLRGSQCFEDDSMLLGYYYYYGTKRNWSPKVNYNSVVYHAVAGQRLTTGGGVTENYLGLVKQYGFMGIKALSKLHSSLWHQRFFGDRYQEAIK